MRNKTIANTADTLAIGQRNKIPPRAELTYARLIRLAQSPNASDRHCTGLLTRTRARSSSVIFPLVFPTACFCRMCLRAKNIETCSFCYREHTVGGAFRKKLVGQMPCQLMVVLGIPGKQEFKCQKVFESDIFASLRWKMVVLNPENDQI